MQSWPRIAVPNIFGFTPFFCIHTNKEFSAVYLKGSKDSKQQSAVVTQHCPRDICWAGAARSSPPPPPQWPGGVWVTTWDPSLCRSRCLLFSSAVHTPPIFAKKVPSCLWTQPTACIMHEGPQLTPPRGPLHIGQCKIFVSFAEKEMLVIYIKRRVHIPN